MDEKNYYPTECKGCSEDCYSCMKTFNDVRLADIRQLAAKRTMKLQAISRLQNEVAIIDKQLEGIMK